MKRKPRVGMSEKLEPVTSAEWINKKELKHSQAIPASPSTLR